MFNAGKRDREKAGGRDKESGRQSVQVRQSGKRWGAELILPGKAPKFIELKTETGKLSNLQRVQITRLKDLGQDVRVLYGLEDVKEFLEEMQHGI
ncbi:MAG: VRR-NUC domain-containing protein [Dysosmobacter sp.]